MPCIECENGKWKWGQNGECIHDTKEECEKANEGNMRHSKDKKNNKSKKKAKRLDANVYEELNAQYPHVTDRIYNRALAISRPKLDAVIQALGVRLDLDDPGVLAEFRTSNGDNRHQKLFQQIEGVAIIPIFGTLVQRAGAMEALSGLTSYQQIDNMFFAAVQDDSVKHIVLDIDSPGGEVSGVFDLVDRMVEARGSKPITAISNESAFSAAYAIASAADEIVVTRTAGVGSIGVIALHVDRSGAEEQAGIRVTEIFAGEKKSDGSPHKPLSDRAQNDIQTVVDDVFELFVDTVARNRNMTAKQIIDTKAGLFIGQSATNSGLADRIDSFDNQLQVIVENLNSRSLSMSKDKEIKPDTADDVVTTAATEAAAATDKGAEVIQMSDHTAALTKAETNAQETAAAITEMCVTMKRPELAADFIKQKLSVDQAKAALFDKVQAGEMSVDTSHQGQDLNPNSTEEIQKSWSVAFGRVRRRA